MAARITPKSMDDNVELNNDAWKKGTLAKIKNPTKESQCGTCLGQCVQLPRERLQILHVI